MRRSAPTLPVEWLKKDYQMTDSKVALLVGAVTTALAHLSK